MALDRAVEHFAEEIGTVEPVAVVGGRTHWNVGGSPEPTARLVVAPRGVQWFRADEMMVACGAGTRVDDLQAELGAHGQCVALPDAFGATVGGVLAVGRSGIDRLGVGPVRDTLLQTRFVDACGRVVKAGGGTVKNVSGFDLCRLLVGSLGTLGLLGDVLLRTRPAPAERRWLVGTVDPIVVRRQVHAPLSVLWNGTTTWVQLAGHPRDVDGEAARCGLQPVDGPPPLPPHRWSVPLPAVRSQQGRFIAEIGTGIVHRYEPQPPVQIDPRILDLNVTLKRTLDPSGRLNPGRSVVGAGS